MRSTPTILLLAGLAALPVVPVRAQVNPFRSSSGAGLTASDFHIQDTTARKLTQQSDPHDGETRNWTNPRSGASGRVTVVNSFKKGDMLCRKLEFASKTKGQPDERTTQVNWCQTAQMEGCQSLTAFRRPAEQRGVATPIRQRLPGRYQDV